MKTASYQQFQSQHEACQYMTELGPERVISVTAGTDGGSSTWMYYTVFYWSE